MPGVFSSLAKRSRQGLQLAIFAVELRLNFVFVVYVLVNMIRQNYKPSESKIFGMIQAKATVTV